MATLDRLYIKMIIKANTAKQRIKEFMTSEAGVSNVVATIIILLIVVLLLGIFWGRLKVWLEDMMNTIFNDSDFSTSGMTTAPGGLE